MENQIVTYIFWGINTKNQYRKQLKQKNQLFNFKNGFMPKFTINIILVIK